MYKPHLLKKIYFLDTEHGTIARLQALLLGLARLDAGSDSWQDTSVCVVSPRPRLDPGLLCAATSAMEDMATRIVEIANRIFQLEMNIIVERIARMDAEQHVQTLTVQLQTLVRNPTTQALAQLTGLIGEGLASWTHRRRVGGTTVSWSCCLHRTVELEPDEDTMNSAASESLVMNVGFTGGPEQDSSLALHFLLMMTTTGKNVGHRWQCWRR